MNTIPAIYENGVFRPLAPVDLSELTNVEIVVSAAAAVVPLQRLRDMVEQGAAELDRGDVVDAESVFAELAARRAQLQAATTMTTQINQGKPRP